MITVDPRASAQEMAVNWRALSNHTSAALEAAWAGLGEIFNRAVTGTAEKPWTVAAMPTGTGKTQFAALYCAKLHAIADSMGPLERVTGHAGTLFITPFMDEADRFVDNVNKQTGKKIAAAYHSRSPLAASHAANYPVLAITHEASVRHQLGDPLRPVGLNVWDQLTWWHHSRRGLTIIDEAPSLVVSEQVTSQDVSGLLGSVGSLVGAPPSKFRPLRDLLAHIMTRDTEMSRNRNMSLSEIAMLQDVDLDWLVHWIQSIDSADMPFAQTSDVADTRTQLLHVLQRLRFFVRTGWGWVSRSGQRVTLNTSVMHPSLQQGHGVILDATARSNVGYQLLPDRVQVIDPAADTRRYENVTVHTSPGQKLGKAALARSVPKQWPTLLESIKAKTSSNQLLVCLNKVVKAELCKKNIALGSGVGLANWGAVNGRNQWRDYDAVAIIGLPYLNQVTPINMVLGLIGPQTDEWLQSADRRAFGEHADVVAAVHDGHIASSMLQAINRVRCRKVVDTKGSCAPTSVFLTLPGGRVSDHLIECIRQNMPGAQLAGWDLDIASRPTRKSRSFKVLLDYFSSAPVGKYERNAVQSKLGLSATSVDRFLKRSRDPNTQEHAEMLRINVAYQSTTGRGAKAYFIKN